MSTTVQQFVAAMTEKIAGDLETALLSMPDEKRNWSPLDKGRSALDQVAECALMNKFTVMMLERHAWPEAEVASWDQEKSALQSDSGTALAALKANTETLVAAILAISDSDMGIEVKLPWETPTVAKLMVFPHWNMAYHEGQINYISTLL